MALMTDDPSFQAGCEIRSQLFGSASVTRLEQTDDFHEPLENYVTRACFGETWTRPGLTLRERSLITLAIVAALNRPVPVKRLVKAALASGATKDDIREVLMQLTLYAGVAAGVESWGYAAEALKEAGAY